MTDTTRTEHPLTEAGKALVRSDFDTTGWGPNVVREHVTRAIVAIEQEARAQAEAQTAVAVEALRDAQAEIEMMQTYYGPVTFAARALLDNGHYLRHRAEDARVLRAALDADSTASARFIADVEKPWREALTDCVMQFGYRVPGPAINTAGLSALEGAFDLLGWDDPHPLDDATFGCDVYGCRNPSDAGWKWDGLYLRICSGHLRDEREGKARPPIKQHALDREASRGPDGVLPHTALLATTPSTEAGE